MTDNDADRNMLPQDEPQEERKATMDEVARVAGVSIGTVSRVANNRPGVHKDTKQKVLQAMRSVGYLPDMVFRELAVGQGSTIGLNVGSGSPRITSFGFVLLLNYLNRDIQERGLKFIEIPTAPTGLPEWTADAMILMGAHDDDPRIPYLIEGDIPFVLLGHCDGVRWIMSDDYDGGYQSGSHLLRLGHTRIIHLTGFMHNQAYHDRYNGFRLAMDEAGVEHSTDYILDGEFTALGGYRAVRKALERGMEFSAVAAMSDEMALGAIGAINDAGLHVPSDISVIGFDDLPEIGANLTTIRQDIGGIGKATIELLQEALVGDPVRHVKLPVHLIARQTTARRRK